MKSFYDRCSSLCPDRLREIGDIDAMMMSLASELDDKHEALGKLAASLSEDFSIASEKIAAGVRTDITVDQVQRFILLQAEYQTKAATLRSLVRVGHGPEAVRAFDLASRADV